MSATGRSAADEYQALVAEFGALAAGGHLDPELADLDAEQLAFVRHWARVINVSSGALAVHFLDRAANAARLLDAPQREEWIVGALDVFDARGLGAGMAAFDALPTDAAPLPKGFTGRLADVTVRLGHFVHGLGGRALNLAPSENAFTDTETVYLPAEIGEHADLPAVARRYRLLAVFLWAQNRYGTWRRAAVQGLLDCPRPELEWPVFERLECLRLEACLARDLPGLARDLAAEQYPEDEALWAPWRALAAELLAPGASALDSLALLPRAIALPLPRPRSYQGAINPARVNEVMEIRLPQEQAKLKEALNNLEDDLVGEEIEMEGGGAPDPRRFELKPPQAGGGSSLSYGDKEVELSPELQQLIDSILQDLGELTPEELDEHARNAPEPGEDDQGAQNEPLDAEPPGKVYFYPEWDYARQRFREAYCRLTESEVMPGDPAFIAETRRKYRGLSQSIRRVFAAIQSDNQRLKSQTFGDDLDLDAIVEAQSDLLRGDELSERLYMQFRRLGRNVAVMFMVDMSGSTKGWVNDAEREALLLLGEAIETLGDQYAIYGFSGRTNQRCEIYRIKSFEEKNIDLVERRISGMGPKTYTRMGVAIRHLGALLAEAPARSKLLITLSDGKPEDYGSYRGRYGIEDTRHALLEVKRGGIHAFCITIDREAQDYLPYMYGEANYIVIDSVHKLPYKVADIYRKLTT
ncbi:MAG: nitric oxide reductase activation protein [Gammaproteobacteria bacterium]|nr:nitric oxide reductase activation protein [Gammaproteobacteria bacterium]MBI5616523.1 nitric oxide reductase activation protein [Gammaproteobacteria bacterium]